MSPRRRGSGARTSTHKLRRLNIALAGEAAHQGRTPQPGVPAGPRNSANVTPPSHSGGTSGELTLPHYTPKTPTGAPYDPNEPGHSEQDFANAFPRKPHVESRGVVGDVLQAVNALTSPIGERSPEQTREAAGHLGVEVPKEELSKPQEAAAIDHLAHSFGSVLARLATGVKAPPVELPKGLTARPRSVDVASRTPSTKAQAPNPDPLGKKTLGKATAAELRKAAKEGTLKVSERGILSTPQNRQARQQLVGAHQHYVATNSLEGPLTPSQKRIAQLVSRYTGGILKPRTIATQELQEMSGEAARQRDAEGNFNTLNIGYFDSGPGGLTKDPVWSNPKTAAKATAEFFQGKRFDPSPEIAAILQQAKGRSVAEQLQIIGNSGWATSNYGPDLAATSKLVSEGHDPQAAIQLQAAKKNAKAHGINPTPWNGDVTGGDREYVYVRADAKGMVDWLESATGLQEGSPRQVAMAARLGLGPSEPWCANLVGNGLLRRGFSPDEIPSNPNATSSFEEWGREGRYATDVGTDLAKAKPGDVLTFSGAHTATYVGNGEMISGNFSDEVERTPVSAGPAPLSMIIRPKYKGGKVKIKAGSVVGSSSGSAFGSSESGIAPGSAPGLVGGSAAGQSAIAEGAGVSSRGVVVPAVLMEAIEEAMPRPAPAVAEAAPAESTTPEEALQQLIDQRRIR